MTGIPASLSKALKALPTQAEIDRLLGMLDEALDLDITLEGRASIEVPEISEEEMSNWTEGTDRFDKLTIDELRALTGYAVDGVNIGDSPFLARLIDPARNLVPGTREFEVAEANGLLTKLLLRWHQWVAVIEMVRRTFTDKLGEPGDPTLLADQVGLGKTITVILYIQVLWHLQELQRNNHNWPEVTNDRAHRGWQEVSG